MTFRVLILCIMFFSCQEKQKNKDATNSANLKKVNNNTVHKVDPGIISTCEEEICLELQSTDSPKSFNIFMRNSLPIKGFQCDFLGVNIENANGGLLEEHGFEAKHSDKRILAFSFSGATIPMGEGILTTINFSNQLEEVCMTEIIFAGIDGGKVSNNAPGCLSLK